MSAIKTQFPRVNVRTLEEAAIARAQLSAAHAALYRVVCPAGYARPGFERESAEMGRIEWAQRALIKVRKARKLF